VRIKKLLLEKPSDVDWNSILQNHRDMIAKIQHERLIHLLVTIFVGLVMSSSAFITIITGKTDLLFVCIPLLILFIAYILHYRFLENTTQNWYLLEDQIKGINHFT
jgi:cell division protein FtsW (lipid II flippase)